MFAGLKSAKSRDYVGNVGSPYLYHRRRVAGSSQRRGPRAEGMAYPAIRSGREGPRLGSGEKWIRGLRPLLDRDADGRERLFEACHGPVLSMEFSKRREDRAALS